MSWTVEDTKDVLKKVLGGVIVAAILAMAYAISERMEWYISAAIGVILVLLIVAGISFLGRRDKGRPDDSSNSGHTRGKEMGQEITSEKPVTDSASGPSAAKSSPLYPDDADVDDKAAKKAAKSDYKRRKKEAKAKEKS